MGERGRGGESPTPTPSPQSSRATRHPSPACISREARATRHPTEGLDVGQARMRGEVLGGGGFWEWVFVGGPHVFGWEVLGEGSTKI